jgi:Ig-like domain-containing protein
MTTRGVVLGVLFLLALASPAMATHIPEASEVITYTSSLQPGVAATGTMGWGNTPPKGYTWYCFDVTSGTVVTLNVKKTSGDLKPNLGVMRGLAETGGKATLPIVKTTSNVDLDETVLSVTPDFTGPVTLWVSTFLGEKNGTFSVTMTGGTGRSSCGAVVDSGPSLTIVPDAPLFAVGNSQTIKVPVQVFAGSAITSDIAVNAGGLPDDVQLSIAPSVLAARSDGKATITISTSANTFPATYPVYLIATSGEQTASNSFLLDVICDPPFILGLDQPKGTTVSIGRPALLSVKASGSGPLTYQWFTGASGLSNFPLPGGTSANFTTSALNDTTSYWVRVSNPCGSVNSQTVTVNVSASAKPAGRR